VSILRKNYLYSLNLHYKCTNIILYMRADTKHILLYSFPKACYLLQKILHCNDNLLNHVNFLHQTFSFRFLQEDKSKLKTYCRALNAMESMNVRTFVNRKELYLFIFIFI